MVNTFLYSVYGQGGGARHAKDEAIAEYRNKWLDALLVDTDVTAVVTLGTLADQAYAMWTDDAAGGRCRAAPGRAAPPDVPRELLPVGRQDAGRGHRRPAGQLERGAARAARPGRARPPTPSSASTAPTWQEGDLVEIPDEDLPAGCPAWMRSLASWAVRTGETTDSKRATITVTVPQVARTWPPPT